MSPHRVRLATLNLYHYAEPGVGWYAADAMHDAESLAAKDRWLAEILAEMDADVVAFQEVVAVERLRARLAQAGYPNFATVAEPAIQPPDAEGAPPIYRRPVQALAARGPMRAVTAVTPPLGFAHALGLPERWRFRRPPARAVAETAAGPVVVYACHLKSPGVSVRDAPMPQEGEPEPRAPGRATLEGLARAHAAATIQRAAEAAALFHDVAAQLAEAPSRPVVVLGDLNDGPASGTLSALTPWAAGEQDGGADSPRPDPETLGWRLIDADRLAPRPLDREGRTATHRHGAQGKVLDFALVSAAVHPGAPQARGHVRAHEVHDRHFLAGDPARSSDHAGVVVELELA